MDQDRPNAVDRPNPEGPAEPTWAAPAPPSSLSQSSLFAEPSPFSREGAVVPPPAPYAPPADPYVPGPYPANPYPAHPDPAPYGGYAPYGFAPVQNQKALLALIFGIAGFVLVSAFIGGPLGIVGIVLGRKARREIDAEPQRYSGRAMATAGFWLGIASVVGTAAYVVLLVVLVVYAPDSGF